MTKQAEKRAAVDVAKSVKKVDASKEYMLATGYRVHLKPVAASLVDEVVGRIEEPQVPMWMNEDKGREEPNPAHPDYLKAVKETDRARGIAVIDAMVMFGIELIDGLPDDGWIEKLRYLEKRGLLDLSAFDLDDPTDAEFVFKRYVAMSAEDLAVLSSLSGMNEEDVALAVKSFRGSTARGTD